MNSSISQKEKAQQLYQLHQAGNILILPNIWDVLGARLIENTGYPAIATASASIAYSNGYNDGEKIPLNSLLSTLTNIAGSVNIPVTADIESGYAGNNEQLRENMKLFLETGIVGINIEDTNHKTNSLNDTTTQCSRIKLIRKVADEMGIPLFINARTDVLLYNNVFPTPSLQFEELLKRGLAYKEAGANCFFPIALKREEDIQKLVMQLKMAINILILPGVPDLKKLNEIGVSRVSLGPGFLKIAIKAMKSLAIELQGHNGLQAITENEITSDYLKLLINTHHK